MGKFVRVILMLQTLNLCLKTFSTCDIYAILVNCDSEGLSHIPERNPLNRRIRTISLQRNNITEIGDNIFSNLKHLRSVKMRQNRIDKVSKTAFRGTKVHTIDLSHNLLSCIPDLSVIIRSLRYLFLSYNKIQADCVELLGSVVNDVPFPKLRTLNLDGNSLTKLPKICHSAPNLEYLYLHSNKLTRIEDMTIVSPKLKSLTAGNNPLLCDCHLVWLKKFHERHTSRSQTICAGPARYARCLLANINHKQLNESCLQTTVFGEYYFIKYENHLSS